MPKTTDQIAWLLIALAGHTAATDSMAHSVHSLRGRLVLDGRLVQIQLEIPLPHETSAGHHADGIDHAHSVDKSLVVRTESGNVLSHDQVLRNQGASADTVSLSYTLPTRSRFMILQYRPAIQGRVRRITLDWPSRNPIVLTERGNPVIVPLSLADLQAVEEHSRSRWHVTLSEAHLVTEVSFPLHWLTMWLPLSADSLGFLDPAEFRKHHGDLERLARESLNVTSNGKELAFDEAELLLHFLDGRECPLESLNERVSLFGARLVGQRNSSAQDTTRLDVTWTAFNAVVLNAPGDISWQTANRTTVTPVQLSTYAPTYHWQRPAP